MVQKTAKGMNKTTILFDDDTNGLIGLYCVGEREKDKSKAICKLLKDAIPEKYHTMWEHLKDEYETD